MVGTIEKANAHYEVWLNAQLHKTQAPPNNITECIDCGGEIGEKRKQVIPYAVRCVACQSEFERGKQ
ncbi:MAG: TraR/DksA C4-type zinc finger protein [Moraxella sp.]|nr:TraR/DksA C4-type zinc finger protein [Moraxella sp.]